MIRCLFRSSEDDTFGDLPPDKLADALARKDGMVWLDVAPEAGDAAEISRLLRESFAFHPLALDDAFQETHVPRVDDWGEYLFVVLHAAELAADSRRQKQLPSLAARSERVYRQGESAHLVCRDPCCEPIQPHRR